MDQEQQQPEQMALVIAETPEAQLFRLINNNRSKLGQGAARLAQLQETKTYFLNVDKFCQNIVPGTPFVTIQRERGTTLIFPHIDQGLNGVFLPKTPEQEYFLSQLNSVVQLVPFDEAMGIQQFKDTIDMNCQNINTAPLEDDNEVAGYIQKSGEAVKNSLVWMGGWLAQGINKSGEYLNSKLSPSEEFKVSESTKQKYSQVKEKAGQFVDLSSNLFMQLVRPVAQKTKEVTSELSQKIDQSDNKYLHQGKQLTVATWDAAGTALTGLGAALSQVGQSLGHTTKSLVEKKYGQDVTQTFIGVDAQTQQQNQSELEPLVDKKNPYPDLQENQ